MKKEKIAYCLYRFAAILNLVFAIYTFVLVSAALVSGIIKNVLNFNIYLAFLPFYLLGLMHLFLSDIFKQLSKTLEQKEVTL